MHIHGLYVWPIQIAFTNKFPFFHLDWPYAQSIWSSIPNELPTAKSQANNLHQNKDDCTYMIYIFGQSNLHSPINFLDFIMIDYMHKYQICSVFNSKIYPQNALLFSTKDSPYSCVTCVPDVSWVVPRTLLGFAPSLRKPFFVNGQILVIFESSVKFLWHSVFRSPSLKV